MASWYYAFLFPSSGKTLNPETGIDVFSENGLKFDGAIRSAVVIDEAGHLEYDEETQLKDNIEWELHGLLSESEQFQIECRNQELFFSCCFATRYSNPHIMLGKHFRHG